MSNVRQKSGLKSAKQRAASLVHTLSTRASGSKESSVGALIVEKIPNNDLEGDFPVSIWAHG